MTVTTTIGSRVRQAREAAGLTFRQLAEKAGVSRGAIWDLETGRNTSPRADTLVRLALALGVEAAWLLTGEGGAER